MCFNNADFLAKPWLFCIYRRMVEPLQFRADLPVAFVSVAVQLLLFDLLFTRPQLLWLGANGTAALLFCVHMGVAVWLELQMRRSFVQRAQRARAV